MILVAGWLLVRWYDISNGSRVIQQCWSIHRFDLRGKTSDIILLYMHSITLNMHVLPCCTYSRIGCATRVHHALCCKSF